MQKLNDLQEMKVKSIIRKMSKVLQFAFRGRTDVFIGFYALMTAQLFIQRYFEEDCESFEEFKALKTCLLKNLSEFQKSIFLVEFKGGRNERH